MPAPQGAGATTSQLLAEANERMGKSIEALNRELAAIRTGRASPALVEGLEVDYYGTPTPLNQIASISIPEARLIVIQPWDRHALSAIEKAIMKSELGLNPANDGHVVRVPIPPLSEERRREIVRLLRRKVEDGKVALRNVRRDAQDRLRALERDKATSQDDVRRALDQLQKIIDARTEEVDVLATAKEAEVMQV